MCSIRIILLCLWPPIILAPKIFQVVVTVPLPSPTFLQWPVRPGLCRDEMIEILQQGGSRARPAQAGPVAGTWRCEAARPPGSRPPSGPGGDAGAGSHGAGGVAAACCGGSMPPPPRQRAPGSRGGLQRSPGPGPPRLGPRRPGSGRGNKRLKRQGRRRCQWAAPGRPRPPSAAPAPAAPWVAEIRMITARIPAALALGSGRLPSIWNPDHLA